VKSKKRGGLFDDLKETFDNLRKYKMMLNPKKYVFGVSSGKLLSYMVSAWGIDTNPMKVEAIKKLQPPQTRREIQKMVGMMAALSWFISNQANVACLSISCYARRIVFSGMIMQWQPSLSLSNILSLCQHWFHQKKMM
jgi:uncharacterized membrane protein YgcG